MFLLIFDILPTTILVDFLNQSFRQFSTSRHLWKCALCVFNTRLELGCKTLRRHIMCFKIQEYVHIKHHDHEKSGAAPLQSPKKIP